jgi:uncharacterized integral membrane protein
MANEHEPAPAPPADSSETAPGSTPSPSAPPASTTVPAEPPKTPDYVPPHTHEHERELGLAFLLKLAVVLFFLGWAIAFVVGNDKSVSVDFVFATGRVSLIWTILLLLLLGLIAGALFSHLYRRHGRKQARKP